MLYSLSPKRAGTAIPRTSESALSPRTIGLELAVAVMIVALGPEVVIHVAKANVRYFTNANARCDIPSKYANKFE